MTVLDEDPDEVQAFRTRVAILAGGAAGELARRVNAFLAAVDGADGYVEASRIRMTMADGPEGAWYAVLVPYHGPAEVAVPE
jgi:hypothetical protein